MFLSGKLLLRNWVPVLSALVSVRWLPDRDPYSAAHYVHGYDHSHMGGGGHGKGAGGSKCCRTVYREQTEFHPMKKLVIILFVTSYILHRCLNLCTGLLRAIAVAPDPARTLVCKSQNCGRATGLHMSRVVEQYRKDFTRKKTHKIGSRSHYYPLWCIMMMDVYKAMHIYSSRWWVGPKWHHTTGGVWTSDKCD